MLTIFINLIPLSVLQGLILSLPAIGIMISFRLFNTADLTPEGTFTLGAAITGLCLSTHVPIPLTLLLVIVCCGMVGILNPLISRFLKIDSLLSSIIVLTMLFSIYLRVMGTSNLPLFDAESLFLKDSNSVWNYILTGVCVCLVVIIVRGYFKTYSGLVLLAVGKNPQLCHSYGFSPLMFSLSVGAVASICSGIGGSLMAQYQEFADVNMGIGIAIQALASLMIGEVLIGTYTLLRQLMAPVLGSVMYQLIAALIISIGLSPTDLKLMTGILVLMIIAFRRGNKEECET
jgi:putative ABC transport system permease protein